MATARHWRLFGLLLLGTAVSALWGLGRLPLLDVDEPVYGEVGKEMAHAHWAGWLSPHYNGALWFDKPPLFYWLTALSMRLGGVSELTARLPSALLSVALVAVTCALARRCYPRDPQAGLWAGFALATTVQFFVLARAAVTDMTLAFTLTTALVGVLAWVQTGRGRWIALGGAMTGLATLAKGPVAVVLIGLQVILFLCLTRQAKRLLSPALWAGFALCLLIALPWYLAMIHLHGGLFIQGFLEANNVTRYLKAEHRETQQYYYLPVFCGFFLPWTLTLPGATAAALRNLRLERGEPETPPPTLFLVLWFALVFLFFSASQTKLITYIFPLFPVAAVLVGSGIAERVRAGGRDSTDWALAGFLLLLGIAFAVLGHRYAVPANTIILWMAVLGIGALLSLLAPAPGIRWAAPGAAMCSVLLIAWTSPVWRTRAADVSDRDAARAASRAVPIGDALYTLGLKHTSIVFYSNRRVIPSDDRAAAMRDMAAHPKHVYVLGPKVLDELRGKYGLRDYRILYAKPRLTLIQPTPAGARGNR